ncbi:MAG: putative addiction module antidote protein [Gammaproteobacteria bacterium]|nr:putative addiction module antidote protein [Gammaproteobacteria bacterium]
MAIETFEYNPFDELLSESDIPQYLLDAASDDDPNRFVVALGNVIKHKGVANIARASGLNRESLYKLTREPIRQPRWDTVHKIFKALGIKIQVVA